MSKEVERAKKALEELEKQYRDGSENNFDGMMNSLKEALVKQYWDRMTRYVN